MAEAVIIHVDMDAFFASVEQRDNPSLKGLPVAVGGRPEERGVIATASYEARKYGVHSAMPSATALKLCPDLVLLPSDHKKYAGVSVEFMSILRRYTPLIEPISLDEAFMDVSGSLKLFGGPLEIGKRVQADIKDELNLTASVGIGPNKLIAKLASECKKPEGLTAVGDVDVFLADLSVSALWGVGPQTVARLKKIGIVKVSDLRGLSFDYLSAHFGVAGERLYQMARGIDPRPVTPERRAKSVGKEITFPTDTRERQVLLDVLLDMSDQVCRELRRQGLVCQGVTLKIKYPDFKTVTRSITFNDFTSDGMRVFRASEELLARNWSESDPVRLVGVSCSRLADTGSIQPGLFYDRGAERSKKLNSTVDGLLDRYGEGALVRGRLVGRRSRRRDEG